MYSLIKLPSGYVPDVEGIFICLVKDEYEIRRINATFLDYLREGKTASQEDPTKLSAKGFNLYKNRGGWWRLVETDTPGNLEEIKSGKLPDSPGYYIGNIFPNLELEGEWIIQKITPEDLNEFARVDRQGNVPVRTQVMKTWKWYRVINFPE